MNHDELMHNPSRWDLRAEWLTLFSSLMYQPCYSVRSLLLLMSVFVMFDYFFHVAGKSLGI